MRKDDNVVIVMPPLSLEIIGMANNFTASFDRKIKEGAHMSEWTKKYQIKTEDHFYMHKILTLLLCNITANPPAPRDPMANESNFIPFLESINNKDIYEKKKCSEQKILITLDQLFCTILYPLYREEIPQLTQQIKERLLDWRSIDYPTINFIVDDYLKQFYEFWDNLKYHEKPEFDDAIISMNSFEKYIIENFAPFSEFADKYKENYLMMAEILSLLALARKREHPVPRILDNCDFIQGIHFLIRKIITYPPFKPTHTFIDPYLIGFHFPSSAYQKL
jgi:hypothetical protein